MKKEKKPKYIDDGHTIYDMNVDAPWNKQKTNKKDTIYVSKEEKRLLIIAAFKVYLPKFLLVLFCFGLTMLLIYLWLK